MISTFKRYEKKYYLTKEQKNGLEKVLNEHMELDKFCKNNNGYLIRNIYYDTDINDIAHLSTEKPIFKEKVRFRKYGKYNDNKDEYFLEIKRKYNGVVYKRRVGLNKVELDNFFNYHEIPDNKNYLEKQVLKELIYLMKCYKIKAKSFISYQRIAYFDKSNPEFRLTFDSDIISRRNDLDFDNSSYELKLLDDNHYLMEVKVSDSMPLWFTKALSNLKIYPKSFSKYGEDYKILKEMN